MDFELFGVLFAIFTALSWYGSVPGTAINQRATIPERVFGALQLTSVFHTASTVRAHFENPTEPGQPTLGAATALPSSLLPELETVLENLKEVKTNRSTVLFYYPPWTVTSVVPWAEPTSDPKTGNPRMPHGYQVPPVAPGNTMRDAIFKVIADTPWTVPCFLLSVIALVSLTRTSKQDAHRPCSQAGHFCSNAVSSEGLIEKLNAIDKTTTRTNDRFNDLHADFASLLQGVGKLRRDIGESQIRPEAEPAIATSRITSIENELESVKRSLASSSEGRDCQFEIAELQRGKVDSDDFTDQFSSLDERLSSLSRDVKTWRQVTDSKTDETDFQDVARTLQKNESDYIKLSNRLDNDLNVLKRAIGLKATHDQFLSHSKELETLKTNFQSISTCQNLPQTDNQATENSAPEVKRLLQEVRDLRIEFDSYRDTGRLAKRLEGPPSSQDVEPKTDAENTVSSEIQEWLNTIQESLVSKADTKGLNDLELKVNNLGLDIQNLRELQKTVQGAKNTQDLGSISKLTPEVEEMKSSASHRKDRGEFVPIQSYVHSEAEITGMQEDIKKIQQDVQSFSSQIMESRNSQASDNELIAGYNDLKRNVDDFRDRIRKFEKLKVDVPELKKKLEEMDLAKASFAETSKLQLEAFKAHFAETIVKLKNEIDKKPSTDEPSGVKTQLDAFEKTLSMAKERYHEKADNFDQQITNLKTKIDMTEHSLAESFEPELQQLKEAVEIINGKVEKVNLEDLAALKEKIDAIEKVKTPKDAPLGDISKIVEDKLSESKDLRDLYTLRSRVDVIEKGPKQPEKNAPKKKGEEETTIPLLTRLQEIEKQVGFNKDNIRGAEDKGFENSTSIHKLVENVQGSRNLASGAWDDAHACVKAIEALTGVRPQKSYSKEEKKLDEPVPRLVVGN